LKLNRRVENSGPFRVTILLLISGILSLIFSVYAGSQILALIGLGLTFWGSLFLFLTPVKYIEGSLLYNDAVSAYLTVERVITEFNYQGRGYYIPPYPADVYIPEYLKGLKQLVVFISAEKNSRTPSIEEMAKGKLISKNSKGVLITPPGSGIITQIEEKFKVDFTKMELDELCSVLPSLILQDLNLAKEMTMKLDSDQAHVQIFNSLYKNLYSVKNNLKSVAILGDPISSAVACAIAKASGRTVTIQKHQVSPDGLAVDVWYRIAKD
jgi:hypothetical protein